VNYVTEIWVVEAGGSTIVNGRGVGGSVELFGYSVWLAVHENCRENDLSIILSIKNSQR
jgi:hypothetical protein